MNLTQEEQKQLKELLLKAGAWIAEVDIDDPQEINPECFECPADYDETKYETTEKDFNEWIETLRVWVDDFRMDTLSPRAQKWYKNLIESCDDSDH